MILVAWLLLVLMMTPAGATPSIAALRASPDLAGKYEKLELTVDLSATFTNAYNPDDIDLWAEFTAPSHKTWRINGFYDATHWKIRFAANEIGHWSYVVKVKDVTGSGQTAPARFECGSSTNHGWVKIAPNHRYLARDDGTSFYGVGACYPWGDTTNGLDQMRDLGFNVFVYWNGTYDRAGGSNLIESTASGLGRYDQVKCNRIDNLIHWSEERGLGMILVVWPHDYLCEKLGRWPSAWSRNPYKTITTAQEFYADTNAWAQQEKLYRYMIARWGYSTALVGWQTVDEISGTSGWTNEPAAEGWTTRMAAFFQGHDPFKHPTTASHGNFWDRGNHVNDLSNTEIYGNYSTTNIVATVRQLWDGYAKPCIMGEIGLDRNAEGAHRKLWAGLASGISITPLFWSFNQGWSRTVAAQYAPFEKFIAGIDFAGLTSPARATVAVTDAGAYGITSDQITFGWLTGNLAGKSLEVAGLDDGAYRLEWWDCGSGTVLSNSLEVVTNGLLSAAIPPTSQPDLAYKIILNPAGTSRRVVQ